MTTNSRVIKQILVAMIAGIAVGCFLGSVIIGAFAMQPILIAALPKSPTPTPTATRLATITLAPTRTATFTRSPFTPTPTGTPTVSITTTLPLTTPVRVVSATRLGTTPTRTAAPSRTPRPFVQHYVIGRPVANDVNMPYPDRAYFYGTTERGDLDVHHGEEFGNPVGTPLFAVSDGTVVTAGGDAQPACGDDGHVVCGRSLEQGGFYGKLVVIQIAQPYNGQRVFALYGHMNKVAVSVGDQVHAGDFIGEIGMTGVALGPHVHFEIRLGTNDYAHTRNPILWMTPLPGRGSLVGRYSDSKNNLIRGALVDLFRADGTFMMETETYGHDRWPDVNSDDVLGENFGIGDLAAGDYTVRIAGQPGAQRVTVQEGKLSFVELGGAP